MCTNIYNNIQIYSNIYMYIQFSPNTYIFFTNTHIYKFIQTYTSICNFPQQHTFFYEYTHLQHQCALERYKTENAILHVYQV